jgi:type VI secretion system secreted protein VgrG
MPCLITNPWKQTTRFLRLETPLGTDRLIIDQLSARESISQPFLIELDLLAAKPVAALSDLIGSGFSVVIDRGDGSADAVRQFHGIVRRVQLTSTDERAVHYRAELVPWLWFLSQSSDCRIFQNQTVPEIVEAIFREFGFLDFKFRLQGHYERWEYCVQYRETALNFISRLLEQEGIYYYFEHEPRRHTMILVDSLAAHQTLPAAPVLRFHADAAMIPEHTDVTQWKQDCEFRPGRYALKDYNFKAPANELASNLNGAHQLKKADPFELFDFPGEYEDRSGGDGWARIRMEEQEAGMWVAHAACNCVDLQPGFRFDLEDHPQDDQNRNYLLISVAQHAVNDLPHSLLGGSEDRASSYECSFTCSPRDVQYRPSRETPKPFVQGAQTAVVTGPEGDEIWTDQHGRVVVQFHWDRRGQFDRRSSCWIRVSQAWAGPGFGAVCLPRIGQEVIVDFLDGDPDRPIITGRVYNAHRMHPYGLPANQNISGLKSNTVKGSGYNELLFDDTAGAERVGIHAQKDMNTVVLNDQTLSVGDNRQGQIGNDDSLAVKNDQTTKIGNNMDETIGNSRTTTVTNAYVVDCDTFVLNAKTSIKLVTGASTIKMNQAGVITITGNLITVAASVLSTMSAPITSITGAMVLSLNGMLCNIMSTVTNVYAKSVASIKAGKIKLNC